MNDNTTELPTTTSPSIDCFQIKNNILKWNKIFNIKKIFFKNVFQYLQFAEFWSFGPVHSIDERWIKPKMGESNNFNFDKKRERETLAVKILHT